MPDTKILIIAAVILIVFLSLKPLRKAAGLLAIILGTVTIVNGGGFIYGVPVIFAGGVLIFS